MLSKEVQNALIGWESHGFRILKAYFRAKKKGITVNVTQCYAFTNDGNEDDKGQFCVRLQSIIEKCPGKDLTILIEDLNINTGMNDTGLMQHLGINGSSTLSESLDSNFNCDDQRRGVHFSQL
ncbi:unnamed protein product [Schistosoma mattheei]|uniref:Uncharacterized protein n=1 Tax=Schistosoma mattheei TaxID=31246 RepID=A0A183PX71_9TREM|nr:unnamed protein product [Schistosoma mattheei]